MGISASMGNRYVVIMAGGRGERFWPESRAARPKQLLPIVGDKPMLAQTLDRLRGLVRPDEVFVLTNAEQRPAVLEVCPELDPVKVVGEPVGRDTAAAVGLAAALVRRLDPDGVFAILPADAVIRDEAGFRDTLEAAFAAAEAAPVLATIGIPPAFPATGYGYVRRGERLSGPEDWPVFKVERFVEKPDKATARSYLENGDYFWNAGMFVWSVATVLGAIENHAPELRRVLRRIEEGLEGGDALDALLQQHYPGLEKISVDYAILEKAENVVMVESGFDWDDVGEWSAVSRHHGADESGNVVRGGGLLREASGNTVFSRDGGGHLVALLGVEDLVVVHTADATLVCHKDKAQDVKRLVEEIGADEALRHLT